MNTRLLLPVALLSSVGATTVAGAAPRAACNLVTDARGDQQVTTLNSNPTKGEPMSSDFDVLSADVATNKTHIGGVIRLASLRGSAFDDPASPAQRYSIEFTAGKERFEMVANVGHDGASAHLFRQTGFTGDENSVGAGTAEGIDTLKLIVDEDRAELRMTGLLSIIKPYTDLSPGKATLSALRVWSFHHEGSSGPTSVEVLPDFGVYVGGGGGVSSSTDRAESKATYRTGTRSCVQIGK